MKNKSFHTKSLFETVSYDQNSNDWILTFSDSISVLSSGFWRLLENGKISLVSLDHGHQFGLPRPVDMVEELALRLKGKLLTRILLSKDTYDLRLSLTEDLELEIFISSTGYETYQFSVAGKRYIGLGGGDIAIF